VARTRPHITLYILTVLFTILCLNFNAAGHSFCSSCCQTFNYVRVSYFFHGSTTPVGIGRLCEVPRSHSGRAHSVGLLCTNDRSDTATSTWQLECCIRPIFIMNFVRLTYLSCPEGCRFDPNSSVLLRSECWYFFSDVSVKPIVSFCMVEQTSWITFTRCLYLQHYMNPLKHTDTCPVHRVAAPSIPN
jgi:hypothetical protein